MVEVIVGSFVGRGSLANTMKKAIRAIISVKSIKKLRIKYLNLMITFINANYRDIIREHNDLMVIKQ